MKILFVIHDYWPEHRAGVENHTHDLAFELAKKHELYIFTKAKSKEERQRITYKEDGINIIKVFDSREKLIPQETYKNDYFNNEFKKVIDEVKPDIIHIQHLINFSLDFISIVKGKNIPLFLTLHDMWFKCPYIRGYKHDKNCNFKNKNILHDCEDCMRLMQPRDKSFKYRLKSLAYKTYVVFRRLPIIKPISDAFIRFLRNFDLLKKKSIAGDLEKHIDPKEISVRNNLFKEYYNMADVIISPSNYLKNEATNFGINFKKIQYIEHGIKLNDNAIKIHKGEKVNFGFISHITKDKGFYLLLNEFKSLSDKNKDVALKIYGSYDEKDNKIREALSEVSKISSIEYGGIYKPTDIAKIMNKIDVVVVPSLWNEIYGLVVDEAHTFGKPVIISNRGGMPERVKNNVDGLIFNPDKTGDLERAMSYFSNDPENINKFQRRIKPPKSIKEYSSQIENLYLKKLS